MPQYIIDAHTHIFPRKIAAKAASSIGEFYSLDMQFDGMTHELLEEGDRCGVAPVSYTHLDAGGKRKWLKWS